MFDRIFVIVAQVIIDTIVMLDNIFNINPSKILIGIYQQQIQFLLQELLLLKLMNG